jgi:hypothetical protein
MIHNRPKTWACLFLLGLLTGCPKDNPNPTILESRRQPYVADIPVPRKFTLNERRSSNNYTEGRRSVKHLYEGSSSSLEVRNFYVHYMPTSGWQQFEDVLQDNVYRLRFRKAEERCEIRVERSPTAFGHTTQIWATVHSEAPDKF